MSKKKAAAGPLSVETLRLAIVNGVETLDLNSLLRTISAEDKNNPNTMNFLGAWSKLFNDQVHRANAQQLAEALFHLGRLGYYNDNLLHKMVDAAKLKSADFGYREISQCLYGLGKLRFYDQAFTSLVIARFDSDLGEIDSRDVANLIFGVSKFEYYDQQFLDKFANISIAHMAELNSHDIAETLLGIAKIGYRNQDLLTALIRKAEDNRFDQQSLINSSYALTMILRNNSPDNPEHIKDLIVRMVQGIDCNQVRSIEGKRQLSSIYYALDEGRRAAIGNLANKLDTSWDIEIEQNARATTTISNTQADMANYVRTLARDAQEEFYIRELGSSVDIYLPLINAVIQVDGPKHFHSSDNLETNATTKFNSQRISELGYNLLRVRVDDVNYEDVIKNFISKALAPIKAARKRKENRAIEISDAEFEANFAGLAVVSPQIVASAGASRSAKTASPSITKAEPKNNLKKANKKKKTTAAAEDDFDQILAEHMAKLPLERAAARKAESVETEKQATQMMDFIEKRNIGAVKQLLKQGVSPDIKDIGNKHLSALCIACAFGDLQIVKLLLDAGANPDMANEEGTTALFTAATVESEVGTEIVKILLNNGAHANIARTDGDTPLLTASMGNQKSAELILQAGANPNAINNENLSVLHLAAENGYLGLAKRIIADGQVDLDILTNSHGQSPIHYAVDNLHYGVVEALADARANLDLIAENGASPLAIAICKEDHKMTKLLLDKRANPNIQIKHSEVGFISPLSLCLANNLEIKYAKALIDYGSDVNQITMPPLLFAIKNNNIDAIKLLLASGMNKKISLSQSNPSIEVEVNSFARDPIKYITEYDQPTANKIRALDSLLKSPIYSGKHSEIARARHELLATSQAAEGVSLERPSFVEREERRRKDAEESKNCSIS